MPAITITCSDEDLKAWQRFADLLGMPLEKFLTMAPDIAISACVSGDGPVNDWFLSWYDSGRSARESADFNGGGTSDSTPFPVSHWQQRMAEIESNVTVTP